MPVSPSPRSLKPGPKMQLPACQGIGRILLFLWIRTTSLCMVVCACQAVGKGKLCDLFSRSPKRHIADWFNACAITKLFSFSSPFVERFSGLTRDCHYFPNSMSLCVCLYMYSTDWGGVRRRGMGICGKNPEKLVQCIPPGLWNWETGIRDRREKPYFF